MDKKLPHIAIAILNYNGRKLLESYLPSVMSVEYTNTSIWIIDNGSSDDSLSFLKSHYPKVKIIENAGNFGFAKGYNEGLKQIEADYYLLLNSDVEVNPHLITPILEAMEKDSSIAFAQPKMLWHRHPDSFEYAGAAGGLIDALGYPYCRGRVFDLLEKDLGQYDDSPFVFWASGACLFARADIYRELGGMYEYFFMHNEEIDLCWRAQNRGYKILACGQTHVLHLGAASLAKTNPKKTYLNFRNNLVMLTRNMPVGRLLWLLPARFFLDGLAALSFLVKGESKDSVAVFQAWGGFFSWLMAQNQDKFPGKRGFSQLNGSTGKIALWKRFGFGK